MNKFVLFKSSPKFRRLVPFVHLGTTLLFKPLIINTSNNYLCVLVAWFTFDPCLSSPELCFTPDNMTVTCEGFEHRVALGSVGFSRGVHYWEFTIDRFDADTDPSFGVARLDVSKEEMLGMFENYKL